MSDLPPSEPEPAVPARRDAGGDHPSGRVWRRRAPTLTLVLAIATLVSQSIAISAMKAQPRYDEVAYLAIARSYQRLGGVVGTIRCHLEGRCQEDNRSPLFEMLLQQIASDSPRFYAAAKLYTLGTALALCLLGFLIARRRFGAPVALGVVVLWCLMPSVGELGSRILPDLLFAAMIMAGAYAIAACQRRGVLAWLGTGALIGIAYLTKGNGHLLFAALICVGLHHHGRTLIRRAEPYAAALGFFVVTWFLIRRNLIVFHSPFHNFNERLLWLDNWEETWVYLRDPQKYSIGPGFLLRRHSIGELAMRGIKGLGHTIGVLIYSAGLGVSSLKQPEAPMTAAIAVPRVATGLAIVALGVLGIRRRLATSLRPDALAAIYTLGWFIAAFASGQAGAGDIGVRYVLPLVVVLTPYAVDYAIGVAGPVLTDRLGAAAPWVRTAVAGGRPALFALCAALAVKLAWFAPAAMARGPLSLVEVPPAWARMSGWFAAHLTPGERYAFPYTSLYSTFDQPFPEPDQRWIYLYRQDSASMLRDLDRGVRSSIDASLVGPPGPIDKIFVDAQDALLASYQNKLSTARDAQGPLAFLGWPRCFADGGTPSRFLVFCRPPRL